MRHVAQFQQADVGDHSKHLLDEWQPSRGQEAGQEAPTRPLQTGRQQVTVRPQASQLLTFDDRDSPRHQEIGNRRPKAHFDKLHAIRDLVERHDGRGHGTHQDHELAHAATVCQRDHQRHREPRQCCQNLIIGDGQDHHDAQNGNGFCAPGVERQPSAENRCQRHCRQIDR